MARELTQRQLRNESGDVMRALVHTCNPADFDGLGGIVEVCAVARTGA